MHTARHNVLKTSSILPKTWTGNTPTDTQGQGASVIGFGVNTAVFHVGLSGDTLSGSLLLALSLKESDDSADGSSGDGTWTAVDDSDFVAYKINASGELVILTAVSDEIVIDAAAEDECIITIEYIGDKKWFAPYVNFTGNHSTGIGLGVFIEQLQPDGIPVAPDA